MRKTRLKDKNVAKKECHSNHRIKVYKHEKMWKHYQVRSLQ